VKFWECVILVGVLLTSIALWALVETRRPTYYFRCQGSTGVYVGTNGPPTVEPYDPSCTGIQLGG
jgi:hypothetical protein